MVFVYWSGRSQDPFHINYSIAEGFPSPTVYSVNQDKDGVLWFTTDSGIVKYDSHTYTLFSTDDGLSDNEVFQMRTDYKGRVWFLTLNGKLSYLYQDKFYNESNMPLLKKLSGEGIVMDFYEDTDHTLYFVYKNGELVTLGTNGKIKRQRIVNNSMAGYWKIDGTAYALTNFGFYNITRQQLLLPLEKSVSYYKSYHGRRPRHFSSRNCYYEVTAAGVAIKILEVPEALNILDVFEESTHKTWVCTRNGLFLYDGSILKKTYFKNYSITSILKDFEGGYWLSTLKNGVIYIPSFELFIYESDVKINCVSISQDKEIWFGGENNDYYIKNGAVITKKEDFTGNLPDNILKIKFFRDNTYIVGKSGVLRISRKRAKRMFRSNANDLYEFDGRVYFGSSISTGFSGVGFDGTKSIQGQTLLNQSSNVITGDEKSNIWFGTNTGLYRYNMKSGITQPVLPKDILLQTAFKDLLYDTDHDVLFAATNSKGLLLIKDNKVISQLDFKNGLNSNNCTSITRINRDTFLIGNQNGLNEVQFSNGRVKARNLNAVLGIKNKKINGIASADGILYLATNKGLLSFDLRSIDLQKSHPRCVVETLRNKNRIVAGPSPQFDYAHNDISIKYNGISYKDPENLSYYYKLNTQTEWSHSSETRINYQSLPAGPYTFEVYCNDSSGTSSAIQRISFEILAPFWQKKWFVIMLSLLVLCISYLAVRGRLKKQRIRFEEENKIIRIERDKANLERKMIELEQKALRLQMNPHFIFNALNTIKGYYAEGDTLNASSYISRFSKLLRILLENTEQSITLSKEIEIIDLYIHLNQIRYMDKFNYQLIVDENLNVEEVAIPTLLVQPMVENAIIHGLAPKNIKGLLKVSFIMEGSLLKCIVEDDGIGRKASKQKQDPDESHQSKALEITTERLKLFSQNHGKSGIEIIDLYHQNEASGTQVIITIPLINIWE